MKYTKENLEEAAKQCVSFSAMARFFDRTPVGSTVTYFAQRCQHFGVDTSHFTGQAWSKGTRSNRKKSANEWLKIYDQAAGRVKAQTLRQALDELGKPYKCDVCGMDPVWNGKPLTLQLDHINGKYWDNRFENLQYTCPNCHTQTETWGVRNKKES